MFAPRQRHRRAEHRQIHVTHHRTILDLSLSTARRTKPGDLDLLDQQFHLRARAVIGQHLHVLQAHQRLDNPTRLRHDEGATVFVSHTSKTAAPSSPTRTSHAGHDEGHPEGWPPRQDPKTLFPRRMLPCATCTDAMARSAEHVHPAHISLTVQSNTGNLRWSSA